MILKLTVDKTMAESELGRLLPRVHPAVDDRVVASVRHGEPVEGEPDEGDAAPGRKTFP